MPARELVLLSSSPPYIPDSDIITTPPGLRDHDAGSDAQSLLLVTTSPNLPSPTTLFGRKPAGLKSGSRAAEIPQGAALGFASAGALVRERRLSLGKDTVGEEPKPARRGVGKGASATETAPKPRKRAKQVVVHVEEEDSGTEKPRKRKAKAEESAPTRKTTKGRSKLDSGVVGGLGDLAGGVADPDVAEKPKKRERRAAVNNSDLIKEALGIGAEDPSVQDGKGGAVEKLRRLKAKATTAKPAAAISTDCVAPAKPGEPKPKAQKPLEKKPRKKASKATDEPVANGKSNEVANAPKPKRKPPKSTVRRTSDTTSKHFSRDSSVDVAVVHAQDRQIPSPEERPLEMFPAMVRRRSWTPASDTKSSPDGQSASKPIDVSESPAQDTVAAAPRPSFANLLDGFDYKARETNPAPRTESGEAFVKRRRLELTGHPHQPADSSANAYREASPEKQEKLQKKKARTITDLATAAYRSAEPVPTDSKIPPFFAPRSGSAPVADPAEIPIAESRKSKARSKSPTKKAGSTAKKPSAKSKKTIKMIAEKLLSPETASLRMNRQDVLFGTSSQLAREDSPTFVRDLQQALRDSDAMSTQQGSMETLHLRPAVGGSGLSLVGKRKGLWAAASRDLDDDILREEVGEAYVRGEKGALADDSVVYIPDAGVKAPSPTQNQTVAAFVEGVDESEITGPAPEQPADETNDARMEGLPQVADVSEHGDSLIDLASIPVSDQPSSDYVDIDDFARSHGLTQGERHTIPSSPVAALQGSPGIPRRTVLPPLSTRPNVPLLTKRASDITGLRAGSSVAGESSNAGKEPIPEFGSSPAKRPRGRPRKDADLKARTVLPTKPRGRTRESASAEPGVFVGQTSEASLCSAVADAKRKTKATSLRAKSTSGQPAANPATPKKKRDIDEIEDSEEELSPNPPRRKNISVTSPPLRLSSSQEAPPAVPEPKEVPAPPSPSRNRKTTSHIPLGSLGIVYPQITTAVKNARRSTDPAAPSWHEKILLYDPIVVEDLTTWLNDLGIKVGVVVPVPKPPKNKGRKKKDVDEHDTPEDVETERTEMQELPPWVVQRWCEENSVCCIYKESLWKGRRARY
ncbi:hypothetical protein MPH_09954 [Macrophomina phaseolina MS6]|uniref:Structure-specific endonuclease subunit SLX4 n=1 Tax=Macrophomina phaseolina (strain MS6) TaxID=1126212 RepID=K2RJ64_MACPH|nr:hypothetical protein MPH_09954 [Macrophomina phaseolina MS6]